MLYLVHVRLYQHLSNQGLDIASLVYGGVRPQAVTHHVHVGRLQTLDQHALQRLLQHGGDPCDALAEDATRGCEYCNKVYSISYFAAARTVSMYYRTEGLIKSAFIHLLSH